MRKYSRSCRAASVEMQPGLTSGPVSGRHAGERSVFSPASPRSSAGQTPRIADKKDPKSVFGRTDHAHVASSSTSITGIASQSSQRAVQPGYTASPKAVQPSSPKTAQPQTKYSSKQRLPTIVIKSPTSEGGLRSVERNLRRNEERKGRSKRGHRKRKSAPEEKDAEGKPVIPEYGKSRKRVFNIHHANTKTDRLEGLNITQYKGGFINEKKIQIFIMYSEIHALEEKSFQLLCMLKCGIKVRKKSFSLILD